MVLAAVRPERCFLIRSPFLQPVWLFAVALPLPRGVAVRRAFLAALCKWIRVTAGCRCELGYIGYFKIAVHDTALFPHCFTVFLLDPWPLPSSSRTIAALPGWNRFSMHYRGWPRGFDDVSTASGGTPIPRSQALAVNHHWHSCECRPNSGCSGTLSFLSAGQLARAFCTAGDYLSIYAGIALVTSIGDPT